MNNNIIRYVIAGGLLILFSSCEDTSEKEGEVLEEQVVLDSIKCVDIPELSNDLFHVEHCESYKGDELKRTGFYANGFPIELHSFYENGQKRFIRQYVMKGKDSSVLNNVYSLFPNGDTNITESNFYKLTFDKDTFSIIDSIKFKVELVAPLYEGSMMELIIDYPDNDSIRVLTSKNHLIKMSIPPSKRVGEFHLTGNLREMKINKDSSGISRDLIISDNYYVKGISPQPNQK